MIDSVLVYSFAHLLHGSSSYLFKQKGVWLYLYT
ncbi:hypothetical protein SAMN05216283_106186 [Sunxiuqinia elliptica]|uniref:Uncharacterized protein n=1 Tax=Sunxiuqinia elliptica TaxID=655355 RepID=A0A1I2IQJ6_9BACT|nr:hypothetical protein SAMN05216283_106186 [Sunxiuqinia elliptica]